MCADAPIKPVLLERHRTRLHRVQNKVVEDAHGVAAMPIRCNRVDDHDVAREVSCVPEQLLRQKHSSHAECVVAASKRLEEILEVRELVGILSLLGTLNVAPFSIQTM